MSFVYNNGSLPVGKLDARPLAGAANQFVTAAEWNSVMQSLADIREAILNGDFLGLMDNPAAALSASGKARFRLNGDAVQVSVGGGVYRRVLDPGVIYAQDYGTGEVGIRAAIAAVSANPALPTGITIMLPPGTIEVTEPIVVQGKAGILLKGAGRMATVLKATGAGMLDKDVLKFVNAPYCGAEDLRISGHATNTPRAGIALLCDAGVAAPFSWTTKCSFRRLLIGEDTMVPCKYGILIDGVSGTNANNDFHSFYDVAVIHMTTAGCAALQTQAVDHLFMNCFFNFNNVGVTGPGWTWVGGANGGNNVADFKPVPGSSAGSWRVLGGNSEGSKRFITTDFFPGMYCNMYVNGYRWSADAGHADGNHVIFMHTGPLTLENCRFEDGGSGLISKIALSATADAVVNVRSCMWNQAGADNADVVTWVAGALVGGEGYTGGVFRGAFENNLGIDTNDQWRAMKTGARQGEAFLSGSSGNPDRGTWKAGQRFLYTAPAAAGYLGKVCVTSGIAAPAWAGTTAYNLGAHVFNDTDKVYECIAAGTSAGAGGPTGTGADITDGTVHWKYVGTLAAFKGFGAIEA